VYFTNKTLSVPRKIKRRNAGVMVIEYANVNI